MRVHERHHQEERLPPRRLRAQEGQRPFLPRLHVAVRVHEAAVVVRVAAACLGDVLVGPGVLRVPAGEAVLPHVRGHPSAAVRGLVQVPLPLVDRLVAHRRHHRGEVGKVQRHLHLVVLGGVVHVQLQRVLDPVLGGKVAGHHRGARRRAHARVGEGVAEGHAVALQAGEAREVLLGPPRGEVLDRPLLVRHEQHHVHSGHAPCGGSVVRGGATAVVRLGHGLLSGGRVEGDCGKGSALRRPMIVAAGAAGKHAVAGAEKRRASPTLGPALFARRRRVASTAAAAPGR